MKLRNKKTGEVTDLARRGLLKSDNDNHIVVYREGSLKYYAYNSLAELNEEWEDYKPAEPLIKDEKIRKAVRAWAEANAVKKAEFEYVEGRGSNLEDYFCEVQIEFYDNLELTNRKTYTIAELCGEEEEWVTD